MAQPVRVTEQQVRQGLPVSAIASVAAALDLTTAEVVAWLHIAPRTWARRKAVGRFDTLESDRLARLVRLIDPTSGAIPRPKGRSISCRGAERETMHSRAPAAAISCSACRASGPVGASPTGRKIRR